MEKGQIGYFWVSRAAVVGEWLEQLEGSWASPSPQRHVVAPRGRAWASSQHGSFRACRVLLWCLRALGREFGSRGRTELGFRTPHWSHSLTAMHSIGYRWVRNSPYFYRRASRLHFLMGEWQFLEKHRGWVIWWEIVFWKIESATAFYNVPEDLPSEAPAHSLDIQWPWLLFCCRAYIWFLRIHKKYWKQAVVNKVDNPAK